MPEPVINAIVILVLAAVVALAIRSIWKKHKKRRSLHRRLQPVRRLS